MTKEEAWKRDRYKYRYDDGVTEPTIAMPAYYDGFDAGHAAANQWTYLPELPREDGSFWVTAKDGTVHLGYMKPDMSGFRRKGVVAWMPYPKEPEPAEIKRSEDEV